MAYLKADNTQLRKEVESLQRKFHRCRCIYCGLEVPFAEKDRLADHIMSCEKSPVVQMVNQMKSRLTDYMDLLNDEFIRITCMTKDPEIIGVCQRATTVISQKEPVIKQRDDALSTLDRYRVALESARAEFERIANYPHTHEDSQYQLQDVARDALSQIEITLERKDVE